MYTLVCTFCGPKRNRTAHLSNANAALYQMSYRPIFRRSAYCLFVSHETCAPGTNPTLRVVTRRVRTITTCPRRELNPYLILRTDLLYPLSYKGVRYLQCRGTKQNRQAIDDCTTYTQCIYVQYG